MSEKEEYKNGEDTFGTSKEGEKAGGIDAKDGIKVDSNPDYMAKEAVSATKVKVEHLNFNGDRFKSAPQEADDVKTIKEAEKFVSDTNRMMEEVKEEETKLAKSVKRQEILTERITRISSSAQKNAERLTERQEKNNLRETEKINQLNLEVGTKLNELEEKRNQLSEDVPTNMDEKIKFIQSEEGQALINELLVSSLAENNEDLIELAESMVSDRNVINDDPKSEFVEVIEKLQDKHNFLVVEGEVDDMMAIPFIQHISSKVNYVVTMSSGGQTRPKVLSTQTIEDIRAGEMADEDGSYSLLIYDNMTEGGKTYKLSQRPSKKNNVIQSFDFFEVEGGSHIEKASRLKFEGNTLKFSYQDVDAIYGEIEVIITVGNLSGINMGTDMLIPGGTDMLIPGGTGMLIPGGADMLPSMGDFLEQAPKADMMLHIGKEFSYTASETYTTGTQGEVVTKTYSTSRFDDPYGVTGYGLLISDKTEGGKTYKLSQRRGPGIKEDDVQFNFYEIAEDGTTQISRASEVRFNLENEMSFSYAKDGNEHTWTINATDKRASKDGPHMLVTN